MNEDTWYYARDGRRLGPFDRGQLGQMATAGIIGPADLVLRPGDKEWVEARTVPELFPPPAAAPLAAVSAGKPLIGCERCEARISDVAERCPHCDHPQDALRARERGCDLHSCTHCGTQNWVRDADHFYSERACRGCGRPAAEANPEQFRDVQVDDAYRRYRSVRAEFHGVIVCAGALVVGIGLGIAVSKVAPGAFLVWCVLGGLVGAVLAHSVYEVLYWRLFVKGRPLPAPNEASTVGDNDWDRAESLYYREAVRKNPPPPAWKQTLRRAAWVGGAVGLFALWLWFNQTADRQQQGDKEARIGDAMASTITASKDEGVFSHDVALTNGSKATFGSCDLTLTVYLTSGKQPPVGQYWASWAPGERKAVNVRAGGAVERVDVTGTMVNTATGEKGRLDAKFEWKPKPPSPGK